MSCCALLRSNKNVHYVSVCLSVEDADSDGKGDSEPSSPPLLTSSSAAIGQKHVGFVTNSNTEEEREATQTAELAPSRDGVDVEQTVAYDMDTDTEGEGEDGERSANVDPTVAYEMDTDVEGDEEEKKKGNMDPTVAYEMDTDVEGDEEEKKKGNVDPTVAYEMDTDVEGDEEEKKKGNVDPAEMDTDVEGDENVDPADVKGAAKQREDSVEADTDETILEETERGGKATLDNTDGHVQRDSPAAAEDSAPSDTLPVPSDSPPLTNEDATAAKEKESRSPTLPADKGDTLEKEEESDSEDIFAVLSSSRSKQKTIFSSVPENERKAGGGGGRGRGRGRGRRRGQRGRGRRGGKASREVVEAPSPVTETPLEDTSTAAPLEDNSTAAPLEDTSTAAQMVSSPPPAVAITSKGQSLSGGVSSPPPAAPAGRTRQQGAESSTRTPQLRTSDLRKPLVLDHIDDGSSGGVSVGETPSTSSTIMATPTPASTSSLRGRGRRGRGTRGRRRGGKNGSRSHAAVNSDVMETSVVPTPSLPADDEDAALSEQSKVRTEAPSALEESPDVEMTSSGGGSGQAKEEVSNSQQSAGTVPSKEEEEGEEEEEVPVPSSRSGRGRKGRGRGTSGKRGGGSRKIMRKAADKSIESTQDTPNLHRYFSPSSHTPSPSKTSASGSGSSGHTSRHTPGHTSPPPPESDKPKVMFTGLIDKKGEKTVKDLGGELVDSVFQCTHLVTDKVRRTVKFLCCLSRGCLIVSDSWLGACAKAGHFLPAGAYLVKDKNSERQHKFSLAKSHELATSTSLLSGYEIHLTPSIRPEREQMADIIKCSGGDAVDFVSPVPPGEKVAIVSCEADLSLCKESMAAGVPVYTTEFILGGVLKQQLGFESHLMSLPPPSSASPANGRKRKVKEEVQSAPVSKRRRK